MGERALCRIGEELVRETVAKLARRFPAFRSGGRALSVIRAFQLMIPCGFFEQIVDRRRGVVHRRHIEAPEALLRVELIPGTEFQSGDPVGIDADEM